MKLALAPLALVLLTLPALARAQSPEAGPVPEAAESAPVKESAAIPADTRAPASGAASSDASLLAAESTPLRRAEEPAPHAAAPPRYDYFRFGLGFRLASVGNDGFDTFADSNELAQVSLDASYAFYTRGKLAIAAGVAWDVGSRSSGARNLTTSLRMHRLTVPLEARWYFAPWLNVFAKVAPGAGALSARIEDPSAPSALEHTPWVFAADLSVGASIRVVGTNDHATRRPRLWITQELGYGLTTSAALRPRPDREEEDILGSDAPTRLGSLSMNGIFWRAGLAMSF